jgi:lactate dehydrogenase-like 2-hydroxyacid dehydrogenase
VCCRLTQWNANHQGVDAVRNNGWSQNWRPLWLCGKDVHSSTIGIVGMGRIGQAVARRLNGFGCKILYTGPRPKPELADPVGAKYVDMDTLLAQSDFVIPLCPLNASTRQLFNAEKFKKMKQGSIFINASRGPVVDQTALIDALRHGPLFAAGLDVTDPEPLPSGHTLLAEDLKSKLVILPHIGSASYATRENMSFIAADNLVRGLNGEKLKHAVWEATK